MTFRIACYNFTAKTNTTFEERLKELDESIYDFDLLHVDTAPLASWDDMIVIFADHITGYIGAYFWKNLADAKTRVIIVPGPECDLKKTRDLYVGRMADYGIEGLVMGARLDDVWGEVMKTIDQHRKALKTDDPKPEAPSAENWQVIIVEEQGKNYFAEMKDGKIVKVREFEFV